ncbi:MAG: NAD(+)/NADH kinase [Anaerolineaceae bacterium]
MLANLPVPAHILLMPNAAMPKATQLAGEISQFLTEQAVHHQVFEYDYERPREKPNLTGWDLLIVLGGDGTLLRAGHMCSPLSIPLLGVQAGRLSFLSEFTESNWPELLPKLLKGAYHLEKRMMLAAELVHESKKVGEWNAINELVISRGRIVRPIEIRVDLNEGYLTSYFADGLIVSTATGSTAYALAVGGPILPPELRNMLILPIAPHLSLDRAVVLAEGANVVLRAHCDHEAVMSVDGMEPIPMTDDDFVRITANEHSLQMIRFGEPNYFYRRLAAMTQINPVLKQNHYG